MLPQNVQYMQQMASHQDDLARKRGQRVSNKRKCLMCARTFSKAEHLERHVRSHTKEKPFQCRQCGRKYGRKYACGRHSKAFADHFSDSLLRHIKDHHKNPGDNEIQESSSTSAWPSAGLELTTEIDNRQQSASTATSLNASTSMSVQGDMSNMSVRAYHVQQNHIERLQPTSEDAPLWNLGYGLTDSNFVNSSQAELGFENWLTYGHLDDSLLRDWPFVLDDTNLSVPRGDPAYSNAKPLADLQNFWYTHMDKDEAGVSGFASPVPSNNQEVDDNYRQSLHRKLQIRVLDQDLPSADFLNICVRAYFKRFHPVFPVVHAATFRPSKANAVLLLSICSIGSLLTGHPYAVQRGVQLFERLNKAILSTWENLMRRGPNENFAMIQAALLGQTFGLLSGQAKHLVLVDTFHGTIIAWARRAKVFQSHHQPLDHQDQETRWRAWVRTEERIRIALAVRIQDAEIANTLHHETLMSLASKRSLFAESDSLFFAASPMEWEALYREKATHLALPQPERSPGYITPDTLHDHLLSVPSSSQFSVLSALEDILSAILQARSNETLNDEYVGKLHTCLTAFCRQFNLSGSPATQFDALHDGIKICWHFLFISLHADLDLLEKSIGRDGPLMSPTDLFNIHEWAQSASAKRAVAHAIMIKRNLEHFPLTSEPAMHVPRALFFSAICLFCYSKYGDGEDEQRVNYPELRILDVDEAALLREAKGYKKGTDLEIGPFCGLVDLLQRIGHWEIARKFASLLGALVHAELG